MAEADNRLTRIGVFYDGNFFFHVSNYYAYHHDRRARLSIGGPHQFIRAEVAKFEGIETRFCQIVDAHYFRGRRSANEAEQRNMLMVDRLFDQVLMRKGVITHYLHRHLVGREGNRRLAGSGGAGVGGL